MSLIVQKEEVKIWLGEIDKQQLAGGCMAVVEELLFVGKLLVVLGCGLIAGVFFAFSTFVMSALGRLHPTQGIAAMQSINITVINPLFMLVFLGTAVICLVLSVFSLFRWQQPGTIYLLVGSLLYLVGTFGVTLGLNVPLNEALAGVEPNSTDGASLWAKYLTDWTFWNHVRTIASIAATTFLTLAVSR